MNFKETLDKLCLMAVVPHHPKCPAGMDARLKCECPAGMVKLKVDGCRVNLTKMYESAVAAMQGDDTVKEPVKEPVKSPALVASENRRPVAVEGTAVPSRDTVPLIETPDFAKGRQETPAAQTVTQPQAAPAAPQVVGTNGLPPGPRTAPVPTTKRPK